jgi:hypothetical protein
MNAQIPRVGQHWPVLAGVKATLRVGLRPSLDPGLRASLSTAQRDPVRQNQVSTVPGDCQNPQHFGRSPVVQVMTPATSGEVVRF